MGNVTVQITADEAKALKALDRIIAKERQLANTTKQTGQASERAMTRVQAAQKTATGPSAVRQMGDYVKGWIGVQTAIGAARMALNLYAEHHRKVTEEAIRSSGDLASQIAGRGDIMIMPQVRRQLQAMTTSLTMAEREQVYGAVGGALPSASNQEIMQLVRTAAQGGKAGMSARDMVAFGEQMGEMRKVFRDLNIGDLADVTKYASESFGRRGRRFTGEGAKALMRFTESGAGTGAEGLSYMIAMLEAGIAPEQLGSLVDTLRRVEPKRGTKHFLKSKELKRMTMAQRFRKVMVDDEYAMAAGLGTQMSRIQALRTMAPEKHLAGIQRAAQRDYFQRSMEAAMGDERYRELYFARTQRAQAEIERQTGGADLRALRFESVRADVERRFAQRPIERMLNLAGVGIQEFLGVDPDTAAVQTGTEASARAAGELEAARDRATTVPTDLSLRALPAALEGSVGSLNRASENIERAARGGATLMHPDEDR